MKVRTSILIFSLLLVPGCATLDDRKQLESLESSTETYSVAIRWGKYEAANNLMKTTGNSRQTYDLKRLRKIRVTSYEVLNRTVSKDKLRAEQTVEIKYYHMDYLIEKTVIDRQIWEYDQDDKKWYLISDLPDFR